MKLKKLILNILDTKDILQDINEEISNGEISADILGFHIVVTNKTNNIVNCDFLMKSMDSLKWSIDMKKTVNDCINAELNLQKSTINIQPNITVDFLVWNDDKKSFILKSVKNYFNEDNKNGDLKSLLLDNVNDKNFEDLFGFRKKYHFDQYRFLLVLNLCDNMTLENEKFIKELVDKIIKDAKKERMITDDNIFYTNVFNNLLEENAGILDSFKNYRIQIINKLRLKVKNIGEYLNNGETTISFNRNAYDGLTMYKKIELDNRVFTKDKKEEKFLVGNKIENNPFDRHKVVRKINNKTINNELFLLNEYERKGSYFAANNSVILYKYKNVSLSEIEKTIEKLIIASAGETYEIIIYFNHVKFSMQFEKILENLFFNYDYLFKIKIVMPYNKIGKIETKYSEIQKLIIMSNFVNCSANYYFILSINSWMPPRYISFIRKKYSDEKEIIMMLKSSNVINIDNGRIDIYEANTNKLFSYFVECLFPVVPKNLLTKINFKSNIFGGINKFKELKNFLVKNGTINDVEIYDYFNKDSLHVFEGGS